MRSYLSVDLDFWMYHLNDTASVKFFNKIFSLKKKINVVQSHEELLPHINDTQADFLYNVDYHSDIFGFSDQNDIDDWFKKEVPEEGSWAVFVDWRKNGEFRWMRPNENCMDVGNGACWSKETDDPFKNGLIEWKKVSHQVGYNKIDWDSIVEVGVSVSPDWTELQTIKRVANLLEVIKSGNNLGYIYKRWKPFWFDSSKVEKYWYKQPLFVED